MFFLIVLTVLALMYGYVGWRLIVPASFSTPVNVVLWGLILILLVIPFVSTMARFRGINGPWIDVLAWIGYLSFGFITLLFSFMLAKDLIFLLGAGIGKLAHLAKSMFGSGEATAQAVNPDRRHFIVNSVNLGVLGFTGALTGYGIYQALRDPQIVNLDIPIKNLPDEFDGFRIVQITDIHVSSTIKRPFVQRVVDMVNGLNPDLVALTGDLVDGSVSQLQHDTAPLADLKAPHGMFFITGNHEYYSGVEQWIKETRRLGFDVLINEHRVLERDGAKLTLAGVTDFTGGQFSPAHVSDPVRAAVGAPEGVPRILLAHQPKSIFKASEVGYDYLITGHTHGGQYFPYHFLAALTQPYIRGFHKYNDTQIYVSKGTGYWGPQLRIGARSEITVHRLVRG